MAEHSRAISLVVCDLAGTVVDHGSRAPAAAFVELFARHGIIATEAQAREPMGMHKRDHIERMLSMPELARQWEKIHGQRWNVADLDSLFAEFIPIQTTLLEAHADVIAGAAETVAGLRARGIKVAVTTGYNRPMTDLVLETAAHQGLAFDFSICAAEVPAGRPAPWMIFRCMEATGAYPPSAVLNIGDTIADIESGVNAEVWTAGIALTGNLLGLSHRDTWALPEGQRKAHLVSIYERMYEAGAHKVIDSITDIESVISFVANAGAKRHPADRRESHLDDARIHEFPPAVGRGGI